MSRTVEPIILPIDRGIVGQKTTELAVRLNLDGEASNYNDANDEPPYTTYSSSLNIYNSQGEAIPVDLYFTKTDVNTWRVSKSVDGGARTDMSDVVYDNDGKFESQTAVIAAD